MSERRAFDVRINHEARIITIQGIRYSFDLFDAMGFEPAGKTFVFGERRDGVVTIREASFADRLTNRSRLHVSNQAHHPR